MAGGCVLKIKKIILLIFILLLLTSCSHSQKNEPVQSTYYAMGTVIDFTVFGDQGQEAIEKAKEVIEDLEKKMSLNIKDSEINAINAQAGIGPVQVNADTFQVIEEALYYSQLSQGLFDVTIAPITELWAIGSQSEKVPSQEQIQEKVSLVNYKDIVLDQEKQSVFLKKNAMKIDLGGIAKGYATDQVIAAFEDMGIENALVNMGGNIKVLGLNPQKNQAWKVGLRHPRDTRGSHFAIVNVDKGQSVVTSGDYERFFIEGETRYHHIFDGKTGEPSNSDIIGVTIISEDSMQADALSTTVFLLGSEKGLELMEDLQGVEAIIVTHDLKIITTKGAQDFLQEGKTQL